MFAEQEWVQNTWHENKKTKQQEANVQTGTGQRQDFLEIISSTSDIIITLSSTSFFLLAPQSLHRLTH